MKNLTEMGVVEMSRSEALGTNGGGFWKWLGSALAYVAFSFGLGSAILDSGSFEF